MRTDVIEAAGKLSEEYGIMSNIYRMMITAYLQKKEEATWSEIKQFLEDYFDTVNPNTLHFHLKALVDGGIVTHKGIEDKTSYAVGTIPDYISDSITSKILTKLKKRE